MQVQQYVLRVMATTKKLDVTYAIIQENAQNVREVANVVCVKDLDILKINTCII